MYRWKWKLLAIALSLVLTTCAAEITLRSFRSATPTRFFYPGEREDEGHRRFVRDPEIGWRRPPNASFQVKSPDGARTIHYLTDAQGWRRSREPARGEKVVVAVGDSQTWGSGVENEETYGAQVARRLGWAFRNRGVGGFGVDQVWRTLHHHVLPERPDLVLVGIFYDDLKRSMTAFRTDVRMNKPTYVLDEGRLRPMTAEDKPGPVRRWIDEHSRIWNLCWRGFRGLGCGRWWRVNAAILDAMRDECAAAGVKVLFVHIPLERGRRFRALANHLDPAQFVDPVDDEAPDAPLHYGDGHLTATGHRWVAEAILDGLSRGAHIAR